MRNFYTCLKFVFLSIIFIGCQFSEDLHLKEDGSGKISINFDGSELMQIGGDKMSEGKEEIIDSLIVFKDFLEEHKDSIAQLSEVEQEKLKRLENFKMHMLMNTQSKEMKFDMYTEFKNVSELGDLFNDFKTASAVGNKDKGQASQGANPISLSSSEVEGSKVFYSFEKNKFKRVTEILDEKELKKNLDSLEQMKMFLASSKYKLNYHFPRKIKKISSERAMFSQDGKSFVLEVGFLEYMENPKILDVEVELEK
ncbi:hypothetical protein [Aquimarina sp. 2201CG5-10]|uniref:hypothetical protein n=1 Tax=Aquimarina callyspongiae TaxID=3098150 RepID=UPI002AB4D08D|nr:hypothetical protein [Aquimarina sp. 2201CG5-10]MDY8136415.1 hypothetical protein [Aquimarina sp. 2201CG5-10]